MTVSIDIDLSAGDVHRELIRIKAEIEALEDSFDFDLDLDGKLGKKISELGDALSELTDGLTKDLDESITRLENLEIDPVRLDGDGDSGGGTGSDSGDGNDGRYRWKGPGAHFNDDEIFSRVKNSEFHIGFDDVASRFGGGGGGGSNSSTDVDLVDLPGDGVISKRMKGMSNPLKKMIPSMGAWWNLIAMMLPALGALAVQAAGVAAAMGSVAVAGAGLIGLGLIGHGDSMADSFANAKTQIQELKTNLFEVFQPTAQQFSGISSSFLSFAPGELDRVAEAMEGLTAYEDTVFSMFRGLTQFGAEFLGVMVDNEDAISGLSETFGQLLGSSILDLFSGLIGEAQANQKTLIELGTVFKMIAISIYNVFLAVSTAMVILKPMFEMLYGISTLLNNEMVFGLLTAVAVMGLFAYGAIMAASSIAALVTTISAGLIPGITAAFGMLQAYTFEALMATSASYALAQSIATVVATATLLTGIGLAAWAGLQAYQGMKQVNALRDQMGEGGMPTGGSMGRGGGGSTTNYNITFQGNPEEEDVQGMKDIAKDTNYVSETRGTPKPGGS